MIHRLTTALVLIGLAACGDDPVAYSEPISINLKAKSDAVVTGVLTDEKGITTESGNPYGAFINEARKSLSGRDPGHLELVRLQLLLGADSKGVTTLGEVYRGTVQVLFQMNDSNNTFPVGEVAIWSSTSAGPVTMTSLFDDTNYGGEDWTRLIDGSYKVSLRGSSAFAFADMGAEAELQVTFLFEAFE